MYISKQRGLRSDSDLGPHCLPLKLLKHFSRREKQTSFVAIGALRVKRLSRTVCYFLRDFGLCANVAMGLFVITRKQIYQKGNESLLT